MKKRAAGNPTKGNKNARKSEKTPCEKDLPSGLKKRYIKTTSTCRVTFRLPKEAAPDARSVNIVGDFNNWSLSETPMKRLRNGDFTLTLELPCDREYSFRYLVDANRWEKDWFADKHIPGESGVDNSVVVL